MLTLRKRKWETRESRYCVKVREISLDELKWRAEIKFGKFNEIARCLVWNLGFRFRTEACDDEENRREFSPMLASAYSSCMSLTHTKVWQAKMQFQILVSCSCSNPDAVNQSMLKLIQFTHHHRAELFSPHTRENWHFFLHPFKENSIETVQMDRSSTHLNTTLSFFWIFFNNDIERE